MSIKLSWVLIAAAVLIALGGFLIWSHGNSRYNEGVAIGTASCEKSQAQTETKANDDARKTKEKSADDEKHIEDDGLDAALSELGILRLDTDR